MKYYLLKTSNAKRTLILCFLIYLSLLTTQAFAIEPLTFGHSEKLFSKVLNEERTLLIKLPEGYENATESNYPVFYTLDGDTHFHRVAGTLQWLSDVAGVIPQHIVVALVADSSKQRLLNARTYKTKNYKDGKVIPAEDFSLFLAKELIPYIDKTYRTQPIRTMAGHSAAGRSTLHTLKTTNNLFQAFIAMSPALSESERDLTFMKEVASKPKYAITSPIFLYVTLGNEPIYQESFDTLKQSLEENESEFLNWKSKIYSTESHMSNPSKTLHDAMMAISDFRGWSVPQNVTQQGLTAVKQYYKRLSKKFSESISPDENMLINMAYGQYQLKKFDKAITIFKLAAELYPHSSNAFDSLADGYEAADFLILAKESQEKAVYLAQQQNGRNLAQVKQHLAAINNKLEK